MAQDSMRERTDRAKMAQKRLSVKDTLYNSIRQTESVLYHRRTGLSYTVASRELVHQVPPQRSLYPLAFRAIPNTP